MDSFEYNKLIGALLGTVFIVFTIGLVSDWLFAAPVPENPGYKIEAAAEDAGGGSEAKKEEVTPIAVRLASADVGKGETEFKKCHACHDGTKGGPNKVGPNLWGVVNRPVASHEGFAYSAGMKAFAEGGTHWDFEHLDKFITSPKADVKGTAMGFAGIKDPQDRADVIAYLRTLADEPVPLPAADAAPAAENASAPAEGDKAAPAEGDKAEKAPAEGDKAAPAEGEKAPAEGEKPAQ